MWRAVRGYDKFGLNEWISSVEFSPEVYPIWLAEQSDPQPFVVADAHNDPIWVSLPETPWIRSHMNMPIVLDGEILGFINLDATQPNYFGEEHTAALITFGNQVAMALKNARLFTAERAQRRLAEAVRAGVAVLIQSLDMDDVLDAIIDQIEQHLPPSERIAISFIEGEQIMVMRPPPVRRSQPGVFCSTGAAAYRFDPAV